MNRREGEIGGTQVTWFEDDARTPILYLHGVPDSARTWEPFLARTGGIAPDLPGFGESGKPAHFDYSIEGYGDFLEALVDHLGLDRFKLVMHDWGAVGFELAQRRPAAIERLVAIDVVPFVPGYRWHQTARIWRTPVVGELFMGSSTKWATRRWMRIQKALKADDVNAFVEDSWRFFDHGTQRAILKLYRSSPSDVLARAGERLGEVNAPALVLWGEHDRFLPHELAHRLGDALGGPARVEVVPDAIHWIWRERPNVVDTVADFLTEG